MHKTDWPEVYAKKTFNTKRWTKRKKDLWVTTRKWYQPTLKWKEFAERDGIELPADIDKFGWR